MGQWCSTDETGGTTICDDTCANGEYEPNTTRSVAYTKDKVFSDTDCCSTDGYEASTSGEDDSKSVISQTITPQELNVAKDGWRKAIESGNETLATFFVEQQYPDIDYNFLDYRWTNGDSSLHIACKNQKARLVFFLLTQQASVNDQNTQTLCTPLHYAVQNRDEKIVDLLLKWDADPNVTNVDKESPISIAATYRDKTIHRMLVGTMNDDEFFGAMQNLDKMKTNSERFLQLQLTADVLKQHSLDARDVLGMIVESEQANDRYKQKHSVNEIMNRLSFSVTEEERLRREKDLALKRAKIAGQNPFSGIGYISEEKRREDIERNLKKKPLPRLEAWLEKRKPTGVVPTYQKRWIVVKGAHMLWSSKQRAITNDSDRKERRKFNGSIHLQTIETISAVQTTNNTKFMVKAKDAKKGSMREYIFRCQNKRERDFWVNGLKQHKKQYQVIMSYLG